MVRVGFVWFVLSVSVFAADVVESDFFIDTIDQVDQTVNLVTDYGASGSDTNDDSVVLQTAIDDMTLNPNGGKIIISSGTFYVKGIHLKPNVHLVADPGVTFKITSGGGPLFKMGLASSGLDAMTVISNVSIRCSSGRYIVDYSTAVDVKPNFVTCRNVDNFLISDFEVLDNFTSMSSVMLNPASNDGQYFRARNGVIKNGHNENAHYGYGTIQSQVAYNILFKDLSGTGGITLRLESGASDTLAAPPEVNIDQIYARNISVTNGHGAVMLGSHDRDNGHVDIDGIMAVSAGSAFGGGAGFDDTCIFRNIHAVYGTHAQLHDKGVRGIPPQLRDQISTNSFWWDNALHEGPSIRVVKLTSPNVTVSNVTAEGFDYLPDLVQGLEPYTDLEGTFADPYRGCNPIPVDGVTISDSTLSLQSGQTALLSATVSPVDATDQKVNWTTDAPAVAIVSTRGKVYATGPGTCTITGRTVDWGYPAVCQVMVTGTTIGSWTELTNDDFESGWGSWVSGGDDAFLTTNNAIGAQCVSLRDDTVTSHMVLSNSIDLTEYEFLKIGFSALMAGLDPFEYIAVEFSDDGGSTWVTVDDYLYDFEFEGYERIELEVLIDDANFSFTSDVKIRIRCNSNWDAEIAYIDHVVLSAFSLDDWEEYFSTYGLSGDPSADKDNDGQVDIVEYALGGDATNASVTGKFPYLSASDGTASFFYEKMTNSSPGITYLAEWTEDLISGPWTNTWDNTVSSPATNAAFTEVERQIDMESKTNIFFRLNILRP